MIIMRCSEWWCDLEHKNFEKSGILVCNEVLYSGNETSGVKLREHAVVSQILYSFTSCLWEVGLSSQNRLHSRLIPRLPSSHPYKTAQ